MVWIILVLIYGTIKGIRDIAKKKAMENNGLVEVLFVYTLMSFLLVTPEIRGAGGVATRDMLLTMFKAFVIFLAFLFSFYAIEKLPLSLYGVMDLSRVGFSMLLGVVVLHETLGIYQWIGLILVGGGILLLKYKPSFLAGNSGDVEKKTEKKKDFTGATTLVVILAFLSAFLNAISGTLDKILMKTMTSGQLQFWYIFYMLIYYGIFVLVTKTKINWKSCLKNVYIWAIAILFIIMDKCLFVANAYEASSVTVMTLLKQISVVVMIVGGRLIYKEKDSTYRMFCALVVIAGIVVSAL